MIEVDRELTKCKQIDRGDFIEFWQNDKLVHCQFTDGWKIWFNDTGALHRLNAPAVIKPDKSEFWYVDGKIHRDNGPAVVRADGSTEFWQNGKKVK